MDKTIEELLEEKQLIENGDNAGYIEYQNYLQEKYKLKGETMFKSKAAECVKGSDRKVTESDCQRLVKEVHTEERVKLEERFKEAVLSKHKEIKALKSDKDHAEAVLHTSIRRLNSRIGELEELKNSDLDQWGKDNPEVKATPVLFMGGRRCGRDLLAKALTAREASFHHSWPSNPVGMGLNCLL